MQNAAGTALESSIRAISSQVSDRAAGGEHIEVRAGDDATCS